MMLHVSDLLHLQRCPVSARKARIKRTPGISRSFLIEPFSRLWTKKLHLEDAPSTHVGSSTEETLELLASHPAVLQARFSYRDLRVRIPALVRLEDGTWQAWYPFLSAAPKEHEAFLMKINALTAEKSGIVISDHKILYINRSYEREGALDADALLLASDTLFNRKNRHTRVISRLLSEMELDLDALIDDAEKMLSENTAPVRCRACTAISRCIYYEECFDDRELEDDSIYFLTTSRLKYDLAAREKLSMRQLEPGDLEGTPLQYAQYMAAKHGGRFTDRTALRQWTRQIQAPVSYLDFEWDTFAFPPYDRMQPYDVLCFQYSLHTETENGLEHTEFFETGDCRQAFLDSLIASIPETGSILVYNMEGAEKLRLLQLARQFPACKEKLEQICARMVDLSKPFETGVFYDLRQRGHYSLKNVLPLFTSSVAYSDLDVQTGLNAVQVYRDFPHCSRQEQEELEKSMKEYCGLDTFAEYIVYHGLLQTLEEQTV